MINPLPPSLGFTYRLVPIWTMEPASPVNGSGVADGSTAEGSAAPSDGSVSDMRLTFKGYEWRTVGHWEPLPFYGFEPLLDNDPQDVVERAAQQAMLKRELDEAARRPACGTEVSDREGTCAKQSTTPAKDST